MIDRQARDKLAEEMRHFVLGFTDNFEFDDAALNIDTKDRGVQEVCHAIWFTYDDLRRHKLEGRWALTEAQMAIVKRAIVFLKSDCEYKWPKWPIYYKIGRPLLWLVSIGILTKRLDNHFHGNGDDDLWPFFCRSDYEDALRFPHYLTEQHASTVLQPMSDRDATPSSYKC
jgi:hypothetical protein